MSGKEKEKKKDLKAFTVGSVQSGAPAPKARKAQGAKIEVSEKQYPTLAGLLKGGGSKSFQDEAQRVLVATQEFAKSGDTKQKNEAQKVQRAYGLAMGLLDNSKLGS